MHPPVSELPGCPAHVFEGASETRASRWLWDFDPFQLAICHTPSWVKIAALWPRGRARKNCRGRKSWRRRGKEPGDNCDVAFDGVER